MFQARESAGGRRRVRRSGSRQADRQTGIQGESGAMIISIPAPFANSSNSFTRVRVGIKKIKKEWEREKEVAFFLPRISIHIHSVTWQFFSEARPLYVGRSISACYRNRNPGAHAKKDAVFIFEYKITP